MVINVINIVEHINQKINAKLSAQANSQFRHVNHSEISDQSDRF